MENLSNEFKLAQYRMVDHLNSRQNVTLVKDQLSGFYCVKKELSRYDIQVYELLKNNRHPAVVRILDYFEYQGRLIVIEEFLNGNTLQNLLERYRTVAETEAVRITLAVCEAVKYLHRLPQPVIHRDIKPENIMILQDRSIKLIDFNISRFYKEEETRDTHILGTAGYAAPEQFGFHQTDERSDIFSLGILMNYMLTGNYPNEGLYQGKLSQVINKCIQMEPSYRYQNVQALCEDIYRLHDGLENPGAQRRGGIFVKIWKLFWAVTGAIYFIRYITLPVAVPSVWGILDRGMLITSNLFLIALYGNFRNLQSHLPICSSPKWGIRLLGCAVYYLLLLCGYSALTFGFTMITGTATH